MCRLNVKVSDILGEIDTEAFGVPMILDPSKTVALVPALQLDKVVEKLGLQELEKPEWTAIE